MKNITPGQLRAARALLKLTAENVADAARIGVASVRRAESNDGDGLGVTPVVEAAIRMALESAGVIFIDENGDGPGVRLAKR